jgi:UDP-glucose 4-epimerase
MINIVITGGNGNMATILKNAFYSKYNVYSPGKNEMNMLDLDSIKLYLIDKNIDIVIHTAIQGGRRTKPDTTEQLYNNILMFENLLLFKDKFKMILNLDSGAIYNRSEDIFKRRESDMFSIPTDVYGFSKYIIYQRTISHANIFNLRIFNVFHKNEENDRFIKSCILSKKNGTIVNIYNNKYFDFFYMDDFIAVVRYYIENIDNNVNLDKTLNLCYSKKYTLFDIAKMIIGDENLIITHNDECKYNYCGDNTLLSKLCINIKGLEYGIWECME